MNDNLYTLPTAVGRVMFVAGMLKIPVVYSDVHMWNQTWSNTACGFGGLAGQAFVTKFTFVVEYTEDDTTKSLVIHNGQAAYIVSDHTEKWVRDFDAQNLCGQVDVLDIGYGDVEVIK